MLASYGGPLGYSKVLIMIPLADVGPYFVVIYRGRVSFELSFELPMELGCCDCASSFRWN